MINKRIENTDKKWKDVLYEVLLTYKNKDIHSSMGMTPAQAKLKENTLQVKSNLELHRVHKRKYPDVNIDDEVISNLLPLIYRSVALMLTPADILLLVL